MAKFCTNCGKELDENSSVCLNCGKVLGGNSNTNNVNNINNNLNNGGVQKKKGLPTWAIVLIVVGCVILIPLIIVVILGVVGYNFLKDNDIDIDDYIEDNFNIETKELVGTTGDTLKGDDLNITLNKALMYSSISDGYLADTPSEGKEFLVFFLDIENTSSDTVYLSSSDFDGYVDGYAVSSCYILNDIDGVEELSVNLASGKKASGFVAFEVDETWKNFELHFDEYDFDYDDQDNTFIFKVVNEDISNNQAGV
ncbi:MAG: DUF4352 domain-containing protein [Bacilli bacterium]